MTETSSILKHLYIFPPFQVVITVVFLTLLSVVILIFFYLYKNKGSYVTYESAEGEPSTILQMESDSAKGREKDEYFI